MSLYGAVVVASYKFNEQHSLGLTLYYTARSLIRSSLDRTVISPTHEIITSEEKSIKHNGILAILGYHWILNKKWSIGASYRPPVLDISGDGSYYQSTTDTNSLPSQIIQYRSTNAFTYIPPKYSIGIGLKASERFTMSLDGSYMTGFQYEDMANSNASDFIKHVETWNAAMGAEYKFKEPNFDWRFGVFTNNSTHPEINPNPTQKVGDNIDMLGFSSNIAFRVSENSQYTIGGFYFGGEGYSVQRTGNQYTRLDKKHHVFSLLISTSYKF